MILLDATIQDISSLVNLGGIGGVVGAFLYGLQQFLKIWREEQKYSREFAEKQRENQRIIEKEHRDLAQKERELYLNILIKELQEQRFLTNDLVKTLRDSIKKPKEKEE
jgi:hypothetical protein